jgi:hypothetical protein
MIRAYSGDSIGATSFFRNRPLLETLLPLLRDLSSKVLFHAVSIGAEAYSFAIYCRMRGIRCDVIDATDISENFLNYARRARYPAQALETMREEEKRFFEPCDDGIAPTQPIRDAIRFLPPCSFVDARLPESYDVVFVMNALTYVTPEQQAQAIRNIAGYNNRYLILTAFHPLTIEEDLKANGYQPVLDNVEEIHNSWGDRVGQCAPKNHSWMLPRFSKVEGYEYKYCAIFEKTI